MHTYNSETRENEKQIRWRWIPDSVVPWLLQDIVHCFGFRLRPEVDFKQKQNSC